MWISRPKPFFNKALARLVFVDETSTNTRLTKRSGWSAKGRSFVDYTPFGNWKTQTSIDRLRCYSLAAPFIVDAPMNSRILEAWIETQLAPTLSPGDVVTDLNLSKLKALLRKRAARSFDAIPQALGDIVALLPGIGTHKLLQSCRI